jgi:lysophospholipase L1-like esterase
MLPRFVLVLFALVLSACGGGSDTPTGPSPNPGTNPDPIALGLRCPAAATASTTGSSASISYTIPVATGGRAPLTVACTPPSGSTFPLGATNVTCTATDAAAATASCTFAVTVARVPTLSRTKFLAFGDSLTLGEVTVPSIASADQDRFPFGKLQVVPSAAYPTQLAAMLRERYTAQTSDIAVTNAGLSGETAVAGAARFPGVISSTRPDVVFLLEGLNDINQFGPSFLSRGVAAVETMAKEARGRGARVFIASLPPPRPGGVNSINPMHIVDFNVRLRSMAMGETAVYVDLHSALSTNVTTYIGVDGLHPTEAGYRRIAEEFFAAVRANVE